MPVERLEQPRPARLGVGQAEACVDQRPAVRTREQVAVDVPHTQGEREGQAPDAFGQLGHESEFRIRN